MRISIVNFFTGPLKMSTSTTQGNANDAVKPDIPILVTLTGDEDSGETNRTFVFNNEGHTLGNALRSILSQYSTVEFCGYTVPHPAEFKMNLRIQTRGPPAVDVLKQALRDLSEMCDHTLEVFSKKTAEFKGVDEIGAER